MMQQGFFPRKVAVTGGLSCGKSTVCRFFEDLGAYTVSADEIVHQLLKPTNPIGKQVIALFGTDIVVDGPHGDRQIARSKIAYKAFQRPELLRSLENLLHPAVHEEIENHYRCAALQGYSLFVAEIPLLFEIHEESYYDATIAVVADPERCVERFCRHTGHAAEEYYRRMARQLDPQVKSEKASYIIVNDQGLENTRAQVANIYAQMFPNNPKGV
jgi:dephospho-CoA kinase